MADPRRLAGAVERLTRRSALQAKMVANSIPRFSDARYGAAAKNAEAVAIEADDGLQQPRMDYAVHPQNTICTTLGKRDKIGRALPLGVERHCAHMRGVTCPPEEKSSHLGLEAGVVQAAARIVPYEQDMPCIALHQPSRTLLELVRE